MHDSSGHTNRASSTAPETDHRVISSLLPARVVAEEKPLQWWREWYVTFRLNFHHFHQFELDLRGHIHVRGAAFSCLRSKLADIVLI